MRIAVTWCEGESPVERLRVLVADNDRNILAQIHRLLAARFEIVGEVEDGNSLVRAAGSLHPDVLVVDISMPIMNGLEAVRLHRRYYPDTRVVFLTSHTEPEMLAAAMAAGAGGFVSKPRAAEDLARAIEIVGRGGTFVSAGVSGASVASPGN